MLPRPVRGRHARARNRPPPVDARGSRDNKSAVSPTRDGGPCLWRTRAPRPAPWGTRRSPSAPSPAAAGRSSGDSGPDDEPSGRVGSRERLHPARGLRQARQAGHPLVARQGQQRRPVAGAQGVLRPRAVPGDARRHREEVPGDVRLPRPLRGGVETQLHPRAVPAGRGHRPDPAACRPLRRAQDPGPEGRRRQARLQRPDPGHPPRRGGDPRQGALLQPARRGQQLEPARTSRRSSGTST